MPKNYNLKNYLYFDTKARNPYRLRHLLKIALPYEGQILTNELCQIIIKDLIKNQWFEPEKAIKKLEISQPELDIKNKWLSENTLTETEATLLLNAWKPTRQWPNFRGSPQDPHWAHRWFQYYTECQVYGLIKFTPPGKGKKLDKFAEPFYITELGKLLINSIPENELSHKVHGDIENTTAEEQIIFAHIMAKHKSSNPFRRCSFSNSPFPLLLKSLLLMAEDDALKAYISLNEVLIVIVWPNNNPNELIEFIREFRINNIGNGSQEEIENYVKKKLSINSLWTKSASGKSAIDAYWRRLKATGLFLRKGYSIYLDSLQKDLINYIIDTYLPVQNFETEKLYFNYISTIDEQLLSFKQQTLFATNNKLKNVAEYLSWEQIKQELIDSSIGVSSKIIDLNGIKPALRYEFICGVAITKKFTKTITNANCRTDSFGWPIGFAIGQHGTNTGADIECFEEKMNFIIEPSRGTSKSEQFRECFSIEEHLESFISGQNKDAKSFFIAPRLSSRIKRFAIFLEWENEKPIMKNLTTDDFINVLENKNNLYESFNSQLTEPNA